jgi:hypothetical protein
VAREELLSCGVEVSEIFHDAKGVFHHAGTEDRIPGPQPGRRSYGSFLSFQDPDGNGFLLQEVTTRLPGRVGQAVYDSTDEVERALREAATAHGRYEEQIGHPDPDWPAWYAQYMARAAGLTS